MSNQRETGWARTFRHGEHTIQVRGYRDVLVLRNGRVRVVVTYDTPLGGHNRMYSLRNYKTAAKTIEAAEARVSGAKDDPRYFRDAQVGVCPDTSSS